MVTDQGDGYTTGCLLAYLYFHNYYKMTGVDLSKQQEIDTDPNQYNRLNLLEI